MKRILDEAWPTPLPWTENQEITVNAWWLNGKPCLCRIERISDRPPEYWNGRSIYIEVKPLQGWGHIRSVKPEDIVGHEQFLPDTRKPEVDEWEDDFDE